MRDAREVVEILDEIYESRFSGKTRGRFKISKTLFKELCERKYLRESFLNEIIEEALEEGLVVIPLENEIIVVNEDVLKNCRIVPEDIVAQYEDEDDWDEEEDLLDEEDEEDEDEENIDFEDEEDEEDEGE